MMKADIELINQALDGDINAFQSLFAAFQQPLKSYLYRLTANRNDAEDLTHDAFIKAYDKLSTFRAEASLKTWVFQIATHLAYNLMQRQRRWTPDVSAQAKELVLANATLAQSIEHVATQSTYGRYEIKEHIDTCFTCIGKNLPIENQIALILKEVYDFSLSDVCIILNKTEGVVKYLLQDGRKTMMEIFESRCALINKKGVCNQCSELNGWFNPRQNQQEALVKANFAKGSEKYDRNTLFDMRISLIKAINPLTSDGNELQEILLKCNSAAMNADL